MNELLYKLNALYGFYKSCHWLSKGDDFYQNHKFFEELYEGLDDEMDALVELSLCYSGKDAEFNSDTIASETNKRAKATKGDFIENIKLASELEEDILQLIERLNNKAPVGVQNHLASIAQNHARNGYLLGRILEE